jgi:two-component system chemotaxis response regulator CheB
MGASAVKSRGGTVIAEDPDTAEFKGMPEAVVASGTVDFILPLDEVAAVIRGLAEAVAS